MGAAQSIDPPISVDYDSEPNFTNADGLHLYTRCWPTTRQRVRGLVFISHGLGEHSGRPGYNMLAKELAGLGVTVYAHDHVGHGRSQGIRIDVADFGVYVRDLVQYIEEKRKPVPDIPIFLMGHSMGGTVAFLTALEKPELIHGVMMSAPGLEPFPQQSGFAARHLLPQVAQVSPSFAVASAGNYSLITRDDEQLAILRDDPFYVTKGTKARWASAYLKALSVVQENMANVNFPFFIAHGQDDRLTNIAGSRHLVERATSTDKMLKEIPNAVHSLLHEVKECREEVLLYYYDWVETRLKKWEEGKPADGNRSPQMADCDETGEGTGKRMEADSDESKQQRLIEF